MASIPTTSDHLPSDNVKELMHAGCGDGGLTGVSKQKLHNLHAEILDLGKNDHSVTNRLHGMTTLDQLICQSNVRGAGETVDQIVKVVNGGRPDDWAGSEGIVGSYIIESGKIGLINNNGKIEVRGPGRWFFPNPRSSLIKIQSLSDNPIQYEGVTIVRVPRGQYGLAYENGSPVLLEEGVHVRNSRLFIFDSLQDANQKYIKHGTIHMLIVPSSEYCLAVEGNIPKILKPGTYIINNTYFSVSGFVSANQEHIQHQTVHIVRVAKGKVALITEGSKPALLPEGTYIFDTQIFTFKGLREINEGAIIHETITRFRVRNGEIGTAWYNNKPIFIDLPDFYEIDSSSFTFVKCIPASEKQIILGSRKRIIVYDGEVGISFLNGKLIILPSGTHNFDEVERIFQGFLSTRQQTIDLIEEGAKDHFLRCDTKELVEIGLKAAVFFRISNPELALLSVGNEDRVRKLIVETSMATIQAIVRSTSLNQVAQSKTVHHTSSDDHHQTPHESSGPMFFDKVHDDFISKLHDTFKRQYGLSISNIRIESFKIMNQFLADNIQQQAIITAQTETKLANLEGQREIATAEMERESAVTRIKTHSQATKLATEAEAKNMALVADAQAKASSAKIVAQGEAEALTIKSKAEAQKLLIKAQAEARAIELKAAAERKRAEQLSATALGQQMALLNVRSQMVTAALKGVERIVYLPPNANLGNTPLQLFGMPSTGSQPLDAGLRG